MELLRNTLPTVTFNLPSSDTSITSVTWKSGSGGTGALSFAVTNGIASASLPYQQYDDSVVVSWTFTIPGSGTYTENKYYEVITPLLTDDEIEYLLADCDEEFDATARRNIERNVRLIIQSLTGQSYGKTIGTRLVRGRGDSSLSLPERLISYKQGDDYVTGPEILSDGWVVTNLYATWPPEIKADAFGVNVATVSPITAPRIYSRYTFAYGANIFIDGIWGYDSVPEPIKEAARLLVLDYAGDASYRDKYLTSMTAADWRIQFEKGAFTGTGNARADQLIAPYIRWAWGVV